MEDPMQGSMGCRKDTLHKRRMVYIRRGGKMKSLQANISNIELLELYGYEPWKTSDGVVILKERWSYLSRGWQPENGPEFGAMRQRMLRVHLECYPDDQRWR